MTKEYALQWLKSGKLLAFPGHGDCDILQWKYNMVIINGCGQVYRCNNFDNIVPYLKLVKTDGDYLKKCIGLIESRQKGIRTEYNGEIIEETSLTWKD